MSPAGAEFFFFFAKKGSDLGPCINKRGLNKITIRNRNPIPLISKLFDQLKKAVII